MQTLTLSKLTIHFDEFAADSLYVGKGFYGYMHFITICYHHHIHIPVGILTVAHMQTHFDHLQQKTFENIVAKGLLAISPYATIFLFNNLTFLYFGQDVLKVVCCRFMSTIMSV